jgi:hypothetical protein
MIKLNELRVGNYISALGKTTTQVEGFCIWDGLIQNSDFAERDGEDFDEIFLTEEWLIKLGFQSEEAFCYELDDISINTSRELIWVHTKCKNNVELDMPEYVHQLQNLYFALTGKELKL